MQRQRAVAIDLTEAERTTLESNVRRRKGVYAIAQRSRMVLLAAEGLSNRAIASQVGVSSATVGLWRRRFADKGLAGLEEAPRGGRPRKIDHDLVETVIATTLQSRPEGSSQWTTRLLARKMGMSQSAISRIWRASGLGSRRLETARPGRAEATSDSGDAASSPAERGGFRPSLAEPDMGDRHRT